MKIAITGHTGGIGRSFAQLFATRGHDIVGISRSAGENIRRTEHTASLIEPCDLFINNAQSMFAQTELLYAVWKKWRGQKKYIWNISTAMTQSPVNSAPDGQDDIDMSLYRVQKLSLEEASRQLGHKNTWPSISVIRPGGVATQTAWSTANKHDVNEWTKSVIDIFNAHPHSHIPDISITYRNTKLDL